MLPWKLRFPHVMNMFKNSFFKKDRSYIDLGIFPMLIFCVLISIPVVNIADLTLNMTFGGL